MKVRSSTVDSQDQELQPTDGKRIKRPRSNSLQNSNGVFNDNSNQQSGLINLSRMSRELGEDKDHKSPLSFSAVSYMVESMQLLHSSVSDKNPDVEEAVIANNVKALKDLCAADFNAPMLAAICAAREDKEKALKCVIDLVGIPTTKNYEANQEGDGLLHIAAKHNSPNCARFLLNQGFDGNGWNKMGNATPMHHAACNGHGDMLNLLIEEGKGNINIGDKLEGQSVLHAAVRANQTEMVKYLLSKKANKIGRGRFTETTLHAACELNHHECAQTLLEDGILVDALRGANVKETALHIASANGYPETVGLLLKYSANPNAKNARDETPLHLAAKMISAPVIRLLIEHGADIDSRDSEGRPPMHFAINSKQSGVTETMQVLIDYGTNINMQDKNGTTALHLAALNRKLSRVRLLIKSGADLCIKNNAHKSALHFVMKYVPNSLRSIEERMDSGLQMDHSHENAEGDSTIKMDFNILIPTKRNGYNYISEVGLFTEVLSMRNTDPAKLEKILMHPLSLSFLHLKWQQIKWLYYLLILCSHFIYSFVYSIYTVMVFNKLCHPDETNLNGTESIHERFTVRMECRIGPETRAAWNVACISWICLIFFNVIYSLKEITKMFHLKTKYFSEWESCLNLLTIASFPMISFHSDPFHREAGTHMHAWQYHAAGVGVLITWILQMFLIGKVPKFGKYVQMLINVGWSFFNFFVAYFTLIIGFALSFVVLFPREVTFKEAITAPIKVSLSRNYVSRKVS